MTDKEIFGELYDGEEPELWRKVELMAEMERRRPDPMRLKIIDGKPVYYIPREV
jgi:hypothetical protein